MTLAVAVLWLSEVAVIVIVAAPTPFIVTFPADDTAVSEAKEEAKADAKAAEARAEEARAAASEAEEAAAAEAGEAARAEAAEAKKPEKKKPADEQRRSKRYVKGNKKQVEPKEEDDSFRL